MRWRYALAEMRPVYENLETPSVEGRPWIAINMVTTIDGKILSGNRDENVMDLGSKLDHVTMRALENLSDAVMIGAGSLRATPGLWYPADLPRFVVSLSGELDYEARFFSEAPGTAFVVTGSAGASRVPVPIQALFSGTQIDWPGVLYRMLAEFKIRRLLVEGGSELNASLLKEDLVDELFWTIAPKIKLGRDVPTYADGEPLDRSELLNFELVSNQTFGDEIYLRYRRRR